MRSAVVVGAGVGGLAAAGALARSGWRVTLIERGDRLRGAGAALLIWPNGLAALGALGLGLGDAAYPVPDGGIRRSDGRWLLEAGRSAGPAPVVVHSDDLHDALMAGLNDAVEIRSGCEITGVRASAARRATVTTEKHAFDADLIVAADGARSVIRRRLAPQSAVVAAGYTAWRAVIPWYRAPAPALPAGQLLGAGQRFVYATLGERGNAGASTRGGIYWEAIAPGAPRPESPATQLQLLRRWFAEWAAPVGDLLEAAEPDDLVQRPGEELRPMPTRFAYPLGTGGVALLGDAAHATRPTINQGACLALEDAATLAAVVRNVSPGYPLPLDEYTELRRARVARAGRTARRLGALMQARGRLTVRARDAALGRLSLLDRASGSVHDWTPPGFPVEPDR